MKMIKAQTYYNLAAALFIIAAVLVAAPLLTDDSPEPRIVMCQVQQYESVHLMPCKIVDSYLAEVTLK